MECWNRTPRRRRSRRRSGTTATLHQCRHTPDASRVRRSSGEKGANVIPLASSPLSSCCLGAEIRQQHVTGSIDADIDDKTITENPRGTAKLACRCSAFPPHRDSHRVSPDCRLGKIMPQYFIRVLPTGISRFLVFEATTRDPTVNLLILLALLDPLGDRLACAIDRLCCRYSIPMLLSDRRSGDSQTSLAQHQALVF